MSDSAWLQGLHPPDYQGQNIVNLMASIIRGRGGDSPHNPLTPLPPDRLSEPEKLLYLVIDGLGCSQLDHYLTQHPDSPGFAHLPRHNYTTVFPATTAAAVTTFDTGASPSEHGILGWFLHLSDLGMVTSILPCQTRTGMEMAPKGFDLGAYLQLPSYTDSVAERRVLLSYDFIPDSRYSHTGTYWHERHAHKNLREMRKQVVRFLKSKGRALAYVYWPVYDSLCHHHGTLAAEPNAHLLEIDHWLAEIQSEILRYDATMLITADHGIWNTDPGGWIDLAQIPGFYDCLATLPSGDTGHSHLFVRPRQEQRLMEILQRHLGDRCHWIPGEKLIDSGVLGPGRPHPQLQQRIGDWVLFARAGTALQSSLPQQPAHPHLGNHGGMQPIEMQIPLMLMGEGITFS